MLDLIQNPFEDFIYVGLVSSLALLVTYFTMFKSGMGRSKYKVSAPDHQGPDDYNRRVRAHQNTIEHLVMYLPGMWLFAFAVSPIWAAGIGVIWPVARLFYALGYYQAPEKRLLPLYISMPVIYAFLLGAPIGFIVTLLRN